jgi:hypothetical protein
MDLTEFQKKVDYEFSLIRGLKEIDFIEDVKNDFKNNISGCFFVPFITIIGWLARSNYEDERIKKNYDVFEAEAEELLKQSDLRNLICNFLKEKSGFEILTQEMFIFSVTEILFRDEIRKKFVIPLEPVLYGFIIYKISKTGIREYCRECFQQK